MTPEQTGDVLAKAAAFDQRTVGVSDVLAWHEAIGELDFADALAAVTRFYTMVTERRMMPGDLHQLVAEIERERRRESRLAIEAAQTPETDPRPLADRSPEIREFVDQVRGVLPEGDPDKLHPRAAHWRREQAVHHEREAEPNAFFDPALATPVADWQASSHKPEGCWWEDERARERHAAQELAKAGRLRASA